MSDDFPQTRYATAPDGGAIAYQVVGENKGGADIDIVFLSDWTSAIDIIWEEPRVDRFFRRLASLGRLILFDKRGSGASDDAGYGMENFTAATVEQGVDDLWAVMDTVGSSEATLVGNRFGGWPVILAAATHPERVGRVVLQDCYARGTPAEGYPFGWEEGEIEFVRRSLHEYWGRGVSLTAQGPSFVGDRALRRWVGRLERLSLRRESQLTSWDHLSEVDVRAAVELIRSETLVIHHTDNPYEDPGHGRWLADHIDGAEHVELDGGDTWYFLDDRVLDAIMRFLAPDRHRDADSVDDRVLAAVVFTDLVSSTERAAELGDARWREVLDTHDRVTGRRVAEHRGTLVKRTGDGIVATFDGPARAVRCAAAIERELARMGIASRSGVHVGEIELRGDDIGGISVHLAARVMGQAGAGEVVVSRTVKDLTGGSGLAFEARGAHQLKGIPDPWDLYVLVT
jgi:class 3 adenylate cyclase